jgi:predicted nucleic acid-binding protein
MGLLIDSNILIDLERRAEDVRPRIKGREKEELFLSVISASELLHGVYRAKSPAVRARRLAFVEGVLAGLPILDLDLTVARSHAQLWSDLETRGIMIGLHDSWLAATCLAHGLTMITTNRREFDRVPGLLVECWS